MDLLKINWTDRAKNDPVLNALFGKYIFEKDNIKTNTSPIYIQGSEKGVKTNKKHSKNVKKLRKNTSK